MRKKEVLLEISQVPEVEFGRKWLRTFVLYG
jgi:hypothetical protein